MVYAVLDIESTGGKFNEEGITEIAIHRFNGHEVVDQFISLVNPEKEIQPYVVNLTGISNKMLKTAPKFHEVAKRIIEITDGAVLVAHNAQFDYRILRTEFRRLGYDYERKTLCTVDLAKKLLPEAESHSLGKLVRSLGIPVSNRHRANGDALATLQLFKILLSKDSDKSILKSVLREESEGELSPRQLDLVSEMPDETGVYYMHNKEGEIIYLGKGRSIKKKVNQHFTNNGKRARRLQKETRKVTFEKTGSELLASLKEVEELKRTRPKFNMRKKYASEKTPGFDHKDFVIVDKGREPGEQSAVLIRNGNLKGIGYFQLNHQLLNGEILDSIITPMEGDAEKHSLIEDYLDKKKRVKIIDLNGTEKNPSGA